VLLGISANSWGESANLGEKRGNISGKGQKKKKKEEEEVYVLLQAVTLALRVKCYRGVTTVEEVKRLRERATMLTHTYTAYLVPKHVLPIKTHFPGM